jgi:hypothetical protein
VPTVHFVLESIAGRLGQRLRIPRQSVQLAIRHAGIGRCQPAALALIVQERFVQM